MRQKKTTLTVVTAGATGLPKSLDVELAKRSKPIQAIAQEIRKLDFSYDDLVLFCATQTFFGNMLDKERPGFLKGKLAALRRKVKLRVVQPNATAANAERGQKFSDSVKEQVARITSEKPGIRATGITALIVQAVQMDTARIEQAKKTGEPWESLDLKFPRKNANGDPYSARAILDESRNARKDIAK